jgi:predicted nuclease of restriction endonuclease-like (RecB) superfamily
LVAQRPRVPDRRPDPRRQGKALNNFKRTLPPADSDFAAQLFKDPYLFDFLGTADPRQEHEVEASLVTHVERFLLELGSGFAFVGRQVPLEVGGDDFKLDLLFYHFKLRRFVVVELKAVKFDPGMVGQLHMYLSAVDDMLKQPDDQPTIGLLLCRGKNELVVEYALRDQRRPMGVADWETQLVEKLPDSLKGVCPASRRSKLHWHLRDGGPPRGRSSEMFRGVMIRAWDEDELQASSCCAAKGAGRTRSSTPHGRSPPMSARRPVRFVFPCRIRVEPATSSSHRVMDG